MNIEEFRNYCLSLDGVTEKTPFGKFSKRFDSILVFYAGGRMFCLTDINDFTFIELKATAATAKELESRHEAVAKVINPTLKSWIHINLNSDLPDSRIFELITDAYRLNHPNDK